MNDTSKVRNWSIAGFFVIVILGSLNHFVYNWTNQSYQIGAFVPVNESVWEHLKLGLWSVITFSIVEYLAFGKTVSNYFFAKAIGIFIISFTILLIYYTYTTFLERNNLILDIASYIIGVLLCQLFCYKIFQSKHSKLINISGVIILIITCALFAFYTYYPPHMEIFKDKRTDTYGIGAKTPDHNKK